MSYKRGREGGRGDVVEAFANGNTATLGVLAGAYRQSNPKAYLTHLCALREGSRWESGGHPIAVACKRVKLESICPDGYRETELAARPTCETCARAWDSLR